MENDYIKRDGVKDFLKRLQYNKEYLEFMEKKELPINPPIIKENKKNIFKLLGLEVK